MFVIICIILISFACSRLSTLRASHQLNNNETKTREAKKKLLFHKTDRQSRREQFYPLFFFFPTDAQRDLRYEISNYQKMKIKPIPLIIRKE